MSQKLEFDLLFILRLDTRGFPVHKALASTSLPPTEATAASRCWSLVTDVQLFIRIDLETPTSPNSTIKYDRVK